MAAAARFASRRPRSVPAPRSGEARGSRTRACRGPLSRYLSATASIERFPSAACASRWSGVSQSVAAMSSRRSVPGGRRPLRSRARRRSRSRRTCRRARVRGDVPRPGDLVQSPEGIGVGSDRAARVGLARPEASGRRSVTRAASSTPRAGDAAARPRRPRGPGPSGCVFRTSRVAKMCPPRGRTL